MAEDCGVDEALFNYQQGRCPTLETLPVSKLVLMIFINVFHIWKPVKIPAITAALIRIKPETGVRQQQAAAEECHQDTANSFTCD